MDGIMTYTATLQNHGVGCNYCIYLVGKDEKDAIRDYLGRKCDGTEIMSIVSPSAGTYHVEHKGREQYVHHGASGAGVERVYSDNFSNFKEVKENG